MSKQKTLADSRPATESQKKLLKYSVIFDTNILFYGNPFRSEISKLVKKYANHSKVSLDYFIPKVVEEELKSKLPQKIQEAKASYGKAIDEINGLMQTTLPEIKISFADEDVIRSVEKTLKKYKMRTLDTPSIGLQPMLKKALLHQPPFKAVGDAGFKDAVISETVKAHSPGLSNTSEVVFICNDGDLKKYMLTVAEEYKFKVYQSIDEFESELKLHLLLAGGSTKLANTLAAEAEQAFFVEEDPKSLFYKQAWEKIKSTFPTLFSNPQPQSNPSYVATAMMAKDTPGQWVPTDKARYEIFKPLFVEKNERNSLIWQSTVVYSQNFEKQTSWSANTGEVYMPLPESGEYKLQFTVRWSVSLASDGKLEPPSAQVLDVDQVKNYGTFAAWLAVPEASLTGPTSLSGTAIFSKTRENSDD